MPTSRDAVTAQTLYLVRHAIAEDRGDAWPDDAKRPLTRKGIGRMRQIARGLRTLGVEIDLVLASPLVRAKQTAELLANGLKPAPSLTVISALSPGVRPPQAVDAIQPYRKARGLALVGHEPDLGELAAWLIGAKAPLPFKKGGVCRIEFDGPPAQGAGQVSWFATPKMLRALG